MQIRIDLRNMPFELGKRSKLTGIAASALLEFTAVVVLLPFRPQLNSTEVALGLLLVVLIAATLFGSRAGLAASVVGILCFNFFFLPPFHTFTITGTENWVAFGAFIVTALIAGQLSGYARRRAEESETRKVEIERLYTELQEAFEQASEAEALRRSEKLKSALLDAVTHDLRTPLTSIKASVTSLLDDESEHLLDGEARSEILEIIDEETDRLNNFIENMVGIARIEADALRVRKKISSAEEIIDNALERSKKRLEHHFAEKEIERDLPNINADAESISEVVYTLIDNAVKYSSAGSAIKISAKKAGQEKLEIAVQDKGRGIAPEMREGF